jgi:hypothetical protein
MSIGDPYQAIAARVIGAIQSLEAGRPQDALTLLKRLRAVLPAPEPRHFEALKDLPESRKKA